MIASKSLRLVAFLLVTLSVMTASMGCVVSDIPEDMALLVGLSWFKDLVIGEKLNINITPQDGCYQNGQQVDCATLAQ